MGRDQSAPHRRGNFFWIRAPIRSRTTLATRAEEPRPVRRTSLNAWACQTDPAVLTARNRATGAIQNTWSLYEGDGGLIFMRPDAHPALFTGDTGQIDL
jgi:hypothetical protein